jgi:signal transduction histidine kinase
MTLEGGSVDPRIRTYRDAAAAMKDGNFQVQIPVGEHDEVGLLGQTLVELGRVLETKFREIDMLAEVTEKINSGLILDDILEHVFDSFRTLIPYDRIGFALLEEGAQLVRARWARSVSPEIKIGRNYCAPIEGSSLKRIMESAQPRIINDLEAYLREKPESESTRLIVSEGMRSSLTCPLIAMGKPIGFIFFSSMQLQTYKRVHVELFRQLAGQLSLIVEKGRLYQELFELNQLKNRFLGMAVHDLRNPLNVVNGYLGLLLDNHLGQLPDKQREFVQRSYHACKSMAALLDDMLDISAIEAGRLDLQLKPHDLEPILREAYAGNGVLASAKRITMTLDIPHELPDVMMDGRRIGQVLNNLISNGIKYSYPETTIRLSARLDGDSVAIEVQDQGQGISSSDLSRIFREFGRGSARPTGGERSTGLGLAIVSRIVKAHGGSVFVSSQVGQGSTFTVRLPVAVDETASAVISLHGDARA